MNLPEYPVVMSDGCAIKARLEADVSRLFSPTAPDTKDRLDACSSGAVSNSEVSP